jgi:pimeloyl-ACP methyl ester carboxylesterase
MGRRRCSTLSLHSLRRGQDVERSRCPEMATRRSMLSLIDSNLSFARSRVSCFSAESFSAPIAARLTERLGAKVALLVLCNPLVEAPLRLVPPFATWFLQSRFVPVSLVAFAMTGGDQVVATAVLREVRALSDTILARRIAVACSAGREDFARHLAAPVLGIVGADDRLVTPSVLEEIFAELPFAILSTIPAPHLAAQISQAAVWAAITAEFERAA